MSKLVRLTYVDDDSGRERQIAVNPAYITHIIPVFPKEAVPKYCRISIGYPSPFTLMVVGELSDVVDNINGISD